MSLIAGKVGIWSMVSKKFVFGIAENTSKDAKRKLREKLGYDALKYRFIVKPISKKEV